MDSGDLIIRSALCSDNKDRKTWWMLSDRGSLLEMVSDHFVNTWETVLQDEVLGRYFRVFWRGRTGTRGCTTWSQDHGHLGVKHKYDPILSSLADEV